MKKNIFQRKAAESAKESCLMFAVDPPNKLADRNDDKHKDKSASNAENPFDVTE